MGGFAVLLGLYPDFFTKISREKEEDFRGYLTVGIQWIIFMGYLQILKAFTSGGEKGHIQWFYYSLLFQHFFTSIIGAGIGFIDVDRALWYLINIPVSPVIIFLYQMLIHMWFRDYRPRDIGYLVVENQIWLGLSNSFMVMVLWTVGYFPDFIPTEPIPDVLEIRMEPNNGPPYTCDYPANTTSGKTVNIIVERTTDPPGSNFYRYTHKVSNGEPQFTLKKVQGDGSQKIEGIPPNNSDGKATAVSAYYWTGNTNKDILVEVAYTGSGTTYYKNSSGDKWVEHGQLSKNAENLEQELDNLNCYSNNAVTLDLTQSVSKKGEQYCCDGHKDGPRVTIQNVPVNHPHVGSNNLTVKKYSITGQKLAAIKLYSGKNRKRIKFDNGQQFPTSDVESVYALYYGKSQNPVLICVGKNGNQNPTGWYRSGSSNTWTKATELDGITPENITECANWNSLVKGLDEHSDSDLQDCSQEKLREQKLQTQQEAQRSGGEESEGQGYKADAGGKEARAQDGVGPGGGKGESGPPGASGGGPRGSNGLPGPPGGGSTAASGDTIEDTPQAASEALTISATQDSQSTTPTAITAQAPAAKESASEPQARSGAEAGTALSHGQGNSPGQNPLKVGNHHTDIKTISIGVSSVIGTSALG
ncbi:hypothetical protein BEWA_036580 [Theileria equi strain WA]|uniref:Uncharacterized protein n=1 Tax=Theileria equi strain WA TaxID=1537102 RepID=L1LDV4_THEEQ|nr:hypothetical protein BEWA_036580 [Theileria equi strain WA]EKX73622.1 hypothetical protein BEWA_036580 [Theileria equi strain WA]|eukprot:XP_004833074.1 hypothetical protein BEWA_036580 [Theileria equi strain WA]